MDEVRWYAEAAMASEDRVFCAGTLAQCIRRWVRLQEADQSAVTIRVGSHTEQRQILTHDQIVGLSQRTDLYKV